MDNSNKDTQSIYEIYRACRLCGGGAGYKMPIIQNIVDLDDSDVELKQKIRDCVQIEVHPNDKMPPLICELCVDKVNDFYEFLDMCRQTNKRTRLRLGLPPQSLPRGAPDAGDCILGLTEPLFVNDDSEGEPLSKHKKTSKGKVKKEPVVRIKIEKMEEQERTTRHRKRELREPTPPRVTRHSKSKDDDVSPSSQKDKSKSQKLTPKSILKKENSVKQVEEDSLPLTRLKRSRHEPASDAKKVETPKKVKISTKSPPQPKPSPKSSPRVVPVPKSKPSRVLRSPVVVTPPKRPPSPVREVYRCDLCGFEAKTVQARTNHVKTHTVGFTNSGLACNPCEDWFPTPEELASHQRKHRTKNIPYSCRRCDTDFKKLSDYEGHIADNECVPFDEVPDVKCDVCWQLFATNNLLDNHKCSGEDGRPGGKCSKCKRSYALLKNLTKHEAMCTAKKRGEPIINKELLDKLKPIQIRVARCDPLLTNIKQEHYDVSCVSDEYGLDRNCYYPYIAGLSEFRGMVNIHDDIKKEFCPEDYVHWDSEDSESDDEISCNTVLNPTDKKKTVPSLTALTLKTIFSKRLLGKMARKKRRLKPEKVFDAMLEDEVRMDIDSIIDNLGNDFGNYDEKFNDTNVSDKINADNGKVNDSDKKDTLNNEDNANSVNNNDDKKSKTDSPLINSVIYDISKEDSIKDNTSVDSLDILKDMRNNFNDNDETNTVHVQNNGSNNGDVDNCNTDDISNIQNDCDTSQNDYDTSKNDYDSSQNDYSTSQNDSSANSTLKNIDPQIDNLGSKDSDSKNNCNENNSKPTNEDKLDIKDQDSKLNNYNDNYTIDKLLNNVQSNDSVGKSESNIINKDNDKVSLDDILNNGNDNKVGLGSIEDFSLDS